MSVELFQLLYVAYGITPVWVCVCVESRYKYSKNDCWAAQFWFPWGIWTFSCTHSSWILFHAAVAFQFSLSLWAKCNFLRALACRCSVGNNYSCRQWPVSKKNRSSFENWRVAPRKSQQPKKVGRFFEPCLHWHWNQFVISFKAKPGFGFFDGLFRLFVSKKNHDEHEQWHQL